MSLTASRDAVGARRGCELADIIRADGRSSARAIPARRVEAKAMAAIEACRTAQLGGHREYCESCDFERFAYNSCRNRHCPKCQSLTKAQWLEARRAELLPVPYFHVVFTLPHELNRLVLDNRRAMLGLLFRAASRTLLQFGRNRFGGTMGLTMILHTWDQLLRPHFHVHCLIAAGALAEDRSRWVAGKADFLFAVHALSKVFRGKFLAGASELAAKGRLVSGAEDPHTVFRSLRRKPWVVYAKKPFAGPEQVLNYLGRYTHRVAISNDRILDLRDGKVVFGYRDRPAGDVRRTTSLPVDAFIGRFLTHVLPHRFVRIRHFGFLANRCKAAALARCRELLAVEPPPAREPKTAAEWVLLLTGIDLVRCPRCGRGPLVRVELEPLRRRPARPRPARPPPGRIAYSR